MSGSELWHDWRGRPPALLSVAILALASGVAYLVLRPEPRVEPTSTDTPRMTTPIAMVPEVAPQWPSAPARQAPDGVEAAAPLPTFRAPSQPAETPYRFIGSSGSGLDASILLFGRGRIVTLRGPGPLDDEYAVEAVFDDYIVLRHLPTGVGTFITLAQRRAAVEALQDPEDSPRD